MQSQQKSTLSNKKYEYVTTLKLISILGNKEGNMYH